MTNSDSSLSISFCCIGIPLIVLAIWLFSRSAKSKSKQSTPPIKKAQNYQYSQQMRQTSPSIQNRFQQVSLGSNNSTSGITISFNYSNNNDQFIKDAITAHDRDGEFSPHVPFMSYWPTYRSFTKEQLYWYLYWRAEVRNGRYPKTDLSYIFVHVYEVLSLIETEEPRTAVERLMALVKAYDSDYPNLKKYVYDWAGDLILTKIGIPEGIEWWKNRWIEEHYAPPEPIMNYILQDFEKEGRAGDLPYPIWEQLNAYRPQNKFYQEHNQDSSIDLAYLKAIQTIDAYLRGLKTLKGILERYTPETSYAQTKYTFSSAIIPSVWSNVIKLGMTKGYKASERLGMFLLSVTKYTENILRKQHNVSAKLSGFKLDERFQKVLDKAFEIQPEPVKIVLDTSKIQSLRAESEQVESLLTTETAPEAKPLYTDIAQVRAMWSLLNTSSRYVLLAIYTGEITCLDGKDANGTQPDLVKNLNEESLRFLGDQIISVGKADSLFIADDFKDEMELIARDNLLDELRPKAGGEAVSTTTYPWQAFFSALSVEERQFIQQFAVAGSMSETEITTLAREQNQMGNLLVDSVSTKAIEYTGNNPFYTEGDRLMFDEEALVQLRSIFVVNGV